MSTHTPGQWEIEVSEQYPLGLVVNRSRGTIIAEIRGNGLPSGPIMANARLIAAAPKLYEKLGKAADLLDEIAAYDGVPSIVAEDAATGAMEARVARAQAKGKEAPCPS